MHDETFSLTLTFDRGSLMAWALTHVDEDGQVGWLADDLVGPFDTLQEHLVRIQREIQRRVPTSAVRLR